MARQVEAKYDRGGEVLYLRIDDETFARIRDGVIAETGTAETITGSLRQIDIEIASPPLTISHLRDRMSLLGCAVICFCLGFVFLVGLFTIFRWFQ